MNDRDFYVNSDLVSLLQESIGETLYFLGINNTEDGVEIFRHYNLAGIDYITVYIYKHSSLKIKETTALHIQRSHLEYKSKYDFVIEN